MRRVDWIEAIFFWLGGLLFSFSGLFFCGGWCGADVEAGLVQAHGCAAGATEEVGDFEFGGHWLGIFVGAICARGGAFIADELGVAGYADVEVITWSPGAFWGSSVWGEVELDGVGALEGLVYGG